MTDDGLTGLSHQELLELVRRQQDALAEREAAIERRDEKTPENSSVPPSQARKANRVAGRRKLGPKRGHVGVSRVRSEPDIVVECRPRACAGCGEELPPSGGRRTGRSQVVELPAVQPVVVEAWQYTVACKQCGEQTAGAYPAGLEPRRTFGPGVEALLSYFHERHHVSYERLVEVCRDVFGLAISQGGVENALRLSSEGGRPMTRSVRLCVAARSSTLTRPGPGWPGVLSDSGRSRRRLPATA